MMILMTAAALAAQAPAAPTTNNPMPQHSMSMPMGERAEHKDCCADCCKGMDAKHDGHASDHAGHSTR